MSASDLVLPLIPIVVWATAVTMRRRLTATIFDDRDPADLRDVRRWAETTAAPLLCRVACVSLLIGGLGSVARGHETGWIAAGAGVLFVPASRATRDVRSTVLGLLGDRGRVVRSDRHRRREAQVRAWRTWPWLALLVSYGLVGVTGSRLAVAAVLISAVAIFASILPALWLRSRIYLQGDDLDERPAD
ncbi:MAG: hypothetical protein PGN07_12535 [Aeromicrobium erythreum]